MMFLALKRECRDNVLDSVHFSAATSCQHASDMFVRDDVTCDSLLASSFAIPPHRTSSALCARTQRQLISSLISFPASRGCARAIIWTLCRRCNYVIPGNWGRRLESQLVYLGLAWARKVLFLSCLSRGYLLTDATWILYSRIIVIFQLRFFSYLNWREVI